MNSYLNIFPNQVNAVVLDGVCPPDKCRIIDYDRNANNVFMYFMDLCMNDPFCEQQFEEDPLSVLSDTNNTQNCIGDYTLSEFKYTLFILLSDEYSRVLFLRQYIVYIDVMMI